MQNTLFITGTDTNVGKTMVTGLMAASLLETGASVAIYKPIQTGSAVLTQPEDLHTLQQFLTPYLDRLYAHNRLKLVNTYNFHPPVTPWIADVEGIISFKTIQEQVSALQNTHDWVLIEGAGGLMAPVTQNTMMLDLIAQLGCPCVLVARQALGTINHTLLSAYQLNEKKIKTALVISHGFGAIFTRTSHAISTVCYLSRHCAGGDSTDSTVRIVVWGLT
jgi:dethiobiotin synthetase